MSNLEHFKSAGQLQFDADGDAVQGAIDAADGINQGAQDAIAMKNKNLLEKNKINLEQEKAIVSKQKLFLTRARMLQVSRDKNSYKLFVRKFLIILFLN